MPLNSINIINYKLNSKLSNPKNSSVFGHLINRGGKKKEKIAEKRRNWKNRIKEETENFREMT